MQEFTVEIKNIGAFNNALKRAPGLMLANINEAIKNGTDYVFQTVKDVYIAGGRGYPKAPIQTGNMRNTMQRSVYNFRGEVYPTVSYAYFPHEGKGTSYRYGRRPFLEDALRDGTPFIQKEFELAITKAVNGIATDVRSGV